MSTAYATSADATTFFTARGQASEWSAVSDPDAALLRASVYIDTKYRKRYPSGRWVSLFPGERVDGRNQDREWPRKNAVDYEGNDIDSGTVPTEVVNATMLAALREGTTPGSLMPDFDPSSDRLTIKEKVGDLEVDYAASTAAPVVGGEAPNMPTFPEIDRIIAPVLVGGGAMVAMDVVR